MSLEPQDSVSVEDDHDLRSIIYPRSSSPFSRPTSGEMTVEDTLLDVVRGNLFENSDPWNTVRDRLNLPPASSRFDDRDSGELFRDLVLSQDRSGVGYVPDVEEPQHRIKFSGNSLAFSPQPPDRFDMTYLEGSRSPSNSPPRSAISSLGNDQGKEAVDVALEDHVVDEYQTVVEDSQPRTLAVIQDVKSDEIRVRPGEVSGPMEAPGPEIMALEDDKGDTAAAEYSHDCSDDMPDVRPNIRIAGPTLFFNDDPETDEEQ